jgi:hypothetical protein
VEILYRVKGLLDGIGAGLVEKNAGQAEFSIAAPRTASNDFPTDVHP